MEPLCLLELSSASEHGPDSILRAGVHEPSVYPPKARVELLLTWGTSNGFAPHFFLTKQTSGLLVSLPRVMRCEPFGALDPHMCLVIPGLDQREAQSNS